MGKQKQYTKTYLLSMIINSFFLLTNKALKCVGEQVVSVNRAKCVSNVILMTPIHHSAATYKCLVSGSYGEKPRDLYFINTTVTDFHFLKNGKFLWS